MFNLQLKKPKIMGILNITPDSFSDGGQYFHQLKINFSSSEFHEILMKQHKSIKHPVARAKEIIEAGADIIDIGGESTGPGSKFVPVQEELRRVIPVILALADYRRKKKKKFLISIDTYKAKAAEAAVLAGANMVNDITALAGDPKMAEIIAKYKIPVVLMYSKDRTPRTIRKNKQYKNVIAEITVFLKKRIAFALKKGIRKNQIIIDPGMGAFVSGDPKYSFEILHRLREFKKLGYPILIGPSRKSFLGGDVRNRDLKSVFASMYALQNSANIIRIHNVEMLVTLLG